MSESAVGVVAVAARRSFSFLAADQFTDVANLPTVTSISPTATLVPFGTVAATGVTVVSATKITAVSPAGSGTVDVTVTTPSGTSRAVSADQFTYNNHRSR